MSSLAGDLTVPALRLLSQVTIKFATDGGVSGFDGLNPWAGRVTRADTIGMQIKISHVASGAMGLGPHAPSVQVELVKAFALIESGQPITMQVNRDQLTIHVGHISLTAVSSPAN